MSRSSGRSATAAAAYRSGTEITDVRTGEIHNYTNRDGVESTGLILPDGAPKELQNRNALWNAAELAESRKNSVVAREVLVAIPHELNEEERKKLVEKYSQSLSDRYQTGVDFAIHEPSDRGDERNFHAHIMMTTRRINEHGFGEKTRELDTYKSSGKFEINNIRQSWEEHANLSLKKIGVSDRIDRRSLADQGIDREPTQHIGVSGSAIDRKGLFSERVQLNNETRNINNERIEILKDLKLLHQERRDVSQELEQLYSEQKDINRVLKKSTRLNDAVIETHANAKNIFDKKMESYEEYKGWHDHEIRKSIKEYHSFALNEAPEQRWFESNNRYQSRVDDYMAEKQFRFEEMHNTISEHRAPSRDKALEIAAGKAAFNHKIKKTEIQENLYSNTAENVQENQTLNDQVSEKIRMTKEKEEQVQERISVNRELLEKVHVRAKLTETKLQENTQAMSNNETELPEESVAEDNTQALIDEGSQRESQVYQDIAFDKAESKEVAEIQAAKVAHDELVNSDDLPDDPVNEQAESSNLFEHKSAGSVGVDVGTDYSEGRERFLEMPVDQQAEINRILAEDYEKHPEHRPYEERIKDQEIESVQEAANPELQEIIERSEEKQMIRDEELEKSNEQEEERQGEDELGY